MKDYITLNQRAQDEFVERKSRFIGTATPVSTQEEAVAFIEEMRSKYWDATHNVYAYILRDGTKRYSDDGEPQGTAGGPVLDVLQKEGLTDLCVVVTRYFGGTLLGTGGLVRAYSGALKEGLKACVVVEKKLASCLEVRTDYNGVGKIQYIAAQSGIDTLDSQHTDQVLFTFLVPAAEEGRFKAQLTEGTNGRDVYKRQIFA